MSEIVKHVGMITNTGKRCAIVFLQIPGKEDHALVVDTEALPDRIHDPIMNIIKTNEAQQAQNLGEVLARRMMPDSGRNVLEELHAYGYLQPQPVTNVMVVPRPNTRVVLAEMLQAMGRLEKEMLSQGVTNPNLVQSGLVDTLPVENTSSTPTLFDDNRTFSNNEEAENVAKGMIAQAELMENDAVQLRAKAYKMAPSLAPKTVEPKTDVKKAEAKPTTKVSSAKTSTPAKGSKVEPKTTGNNTKNPRGKTASA